MHKNLTANGARFATDMLSRYSAPTKALATDAEIAELGAQLVKLQAAMGEE